MSLGSFQIRTPVTGGNSNQQVVSAAYRWNGPEKLGRSKNPGRKGSHSLVTLLKLDDMRWWGGVPTVFLLRCKPCRVVGAVSWGKATQWKHILDSFRRKDNQSTQTWVKSVCQAPSAQNLSKTWLFILKGIRALLQLLHSCVHVCVHMCVCVCVCL